MRLLLALLLFVPAISSAQLKPLFSDLEDGQELEVKHSMVGCQGGSSKTLLFKRKDNELSVELTMLMESRGRTHFIMDRDKEHVGIVNAARSNALENQLDRLRGHQAEGHCTATLTVEYILKEKGEVLSAEKFTDKHCKDDPLGELQMLFPPLIPIEIPMLKDIKGLENPQSARFP